MSDERKSRMRRSIAIVLIGMTLVYVASFGSACWFGERSGRVVLVLLAGFPIGWVAIRAWAPIGLVIRSCARMGLARQVRVAVPTSPKRGAGIVMI
jgi:hypothetical protein